MVGDSPGKLVGDRELAGAVEVVRSGTDANATRTGRQSGGSASREAARRVVCDFCGAARARSERQWVVWDTGLGTELVLAELCDRCAADADRLLDMYGGRGRNALRLAPERRVLARQTARARTLGASVVRGVLYLLVGLALFVVVTLITSSR